MIAALKCITGQETNPYRNIALERVMTLHAAEGECILFLWQNRRTVVIGRNQNAWEECRMDELSRDGGFLARRFSGGGAVYHDLGNLNFSFLARKADYDPEKQGNVILRAVRELGIPAERTGRNDFEADGRKFSGNAFFETRGCCCHHGTIMMDVRTDEMEKYLNVSASKLRSRGVASVRSRVVNLKEYCPGLNAEMLAGRLQEAFQEEYGLPVKPLAPEQIPWQKIEKEAAFLASEEWLFPSRIPFATDWSDRFSWGGIRMRLLVRQNRIDAAECWSDAMEADLILRIREGLTGCRYDPEAIAGRILGAAAEEPAGIPARERIAADIAGMVRQQMSGASQIHPAVRNGDQDTGRRK